MVDASGAILVKGHFPLAARDPASILRTFEEATAELLASGKVSTEQLAGIGVCVPGVIDAKRGVLVEASNFPLCRDVDLCAGLRGRFGVPVTLENDARAAAAGEWWSASRSLGREVRNMCLLTLGTGIGGGLVADGRVLVGMGMAGEVGHTVVDRSAEAAACGCGQRGCLEQYVAAGGIEDYARACIRLRRPADASDAQLFEGVDEKTGEPRAPASEASFAAAAAAGTSEMLQPGFPAEQLTCKRVFELAASDPVARHVLWRTASVLGRAVLNLLRVLDTEVVVLGGGVALAGAPLCDAVAACVQRTTWKFKRHAVPVVQASLGNDAGFVGAARIVRDSLAPA